MQIGKGKLLILWGIELLLNQKCLYSDVLNMKCVYTG